MGGGGSSGSKKSPSPLMLNRESTGHCAMGRGASLIRNNALLIRNEEEPVAVDAEPRVYWTLRGGLVFKAHRLLYHSTLGSRVTKTKKTLREGGEGGQELTGVPRL